MEIDAELVALDDDIAPEQGPATRTIGFRDLPEDVQVLIGDTFGRYDLDDSAFEVLTVPIAAFPVVAVEDDPGDTRYLADYVGVPMEDFPPVLLLGDCWLDGRHRVAAARAQGIETIDAIDLTALALTDEHLQGLRAWNLGVLNPNPSIHDPLSSSGGQSGADRADDRGRGTAAPGPPPDRADATPAGRPGRSAPADDRGLRDRPEGAVDADTVEADQRGRPGPAPAAGALDDHDQVLAKIRQEWPTTSGSSGTATSSGSWPGTGPPGEVSGAGDAPRLDAERIVEAFNRHQVRYVTIGAFAAQQQGALLPPTQDIDFTPAAGRANLRRLSAALDELGARVRTADVPGGLAFNHDAESLARSEIWNLVCAHGEFDLSFRPSGTDGYDDLIRDARMGKVGDQDLPVASLSDIARSKLAAGRPKDMRALPTLYEAMDRQDRLLRPPEPPSAVRARPGPRALTGRDTPFTGERPGDTHGPHRQAAGERECSTSTKEDVDEHGW